MDLPGVSREPLDIELENDLLTIRGQRPVPYGAPERDRGSRHIERAFGRFERSLRVPRGLDPDAIQASLHDGVLTLQIPKPESLKPRKIQVQGDRRGGGRAIERRPTPLTDERRRPPRELFVFSASPASGAPPAHDSRDSCDGHSSPDGTCMTPEAPTGSIDRRPFEQGDRERSCGSTSASSGGARQRHRRHQASCHRSGSATEWECDRERVGQAVRPPSLAPSRRLAGGHDLQALIRDADVVVPALRGAPRCSSKAASTGRGLQRRRRGEIGRRRRASSCRRQPLGRRSAASSPVTDSIRSRPPDPVPYVLDRFGGGRAVAGSKPVFPIRRVTFRVLAPCTRAVPPGGQAQMRKLHNPG